MIPLTSLSVKIGDGICGICSTKTRSCSRLSCEQSLHLHDIENTIHLKRQSSPVSFPIENPLSAPNCTCRVISNHWVARSLARPSVCRCPSQQRVLSPTKSVSQLGLWSERERSVAVASTLGAIGATAAARESGIKLLTGERIGMEYPRCALVQ